MLSGYRQLQLVAIDDVEAYLKPEYPELGLDSPAHLFMTDFRTVHPVVVPETTPVDIALSVMKNACVRMLLVNGADASVFRGIVTASHINGGRVLAFMAANAVHDRDEVLVRDIMANREAIHAFRYEELHDACIGDVVATIRHLGEQHMLVVQQDGHRVALRGIYSAADIASALRVTFDVEPHARTFFELEQAITHHAAVA